MNAITKVARASATRRGVVIGAGLIGGALVVGCSPKNMASVMSFGGKDLDLGAFGPFIKIDPDGSVTVMNKHQEMGQGNHAGLRNQLGKQLQPFRVQRVDKQADARQVAARPGETNDKAIRDRICANDKDDWDRGS